MYIYISLKYLCSSIKNIEGNSLTLNGCHLHPLNAHFHEIMAAKSPFRKIPLEGMLKGKSAIKKRTVKKKTNHKAALGPASPWNRFWTDFLEVWGGSEANFLEVCFGRIPSGNFHTKATSKKSGPPSGNFRPNPPPPTSEKSLQKLFQSRGWLEAHLNSEHATSAFKEMVLPKMFTSFLRDRILAAI